ncbi:restriction endonuclease subunit S [Pontibacter sp. HSC-14F20]|uniref:restriction endonuclease subunit S n=1 Tax=Pontibacter sp. HSC-14F20 TaxID=2864136 RepID=UPI001C72E56F|nr:restriction endonuclease subunit S [Pontibacter sp. HSC-14F20]MBX0332993.1 restriction endonuclease subunit S [Pontibacter sp. HSC-14F20]
MRWEVLELGKLADTSSGGTPSRSNNKFWCGNIPWVKSGQLQDCYINDCEEYITELGLANSSAKTFPAGTLLLALYGATAGKLGILNFPATTNQAICGIFPKNGVLHTKYLYYFLLSTRNQIIKDSIGGAQPNISQAYVRNIKIPLPPLEEQKRIAQVLDKADRLRQKDRQLLAHYDHLLQSVFLDMFGDPVRNEKGWERGTIREIITEAKYGTSKPAELEGEYPYLRMNNLTYSGSMDFTNLKYINLEAQERDKYLVKKGDLLFNRTNSKELVGKTAVYRSDTEMAIAGYLIRVRTNNRANTDYISGYLNSIHGKDTLKGMCKSIVGMANINAQELQDIKILIPPKALQDKYAGIVEKVEEMKLTVTRSIDKSETLFQSLLQKAFKGELALQEVEAVEEQVSAKPKFVISSIL